MNSGEEDARCRGFCWRDGRPSPAPFERDCSWCGLHLDLCGECLESIWICSRCFSERGSYGPDEAKRRAKRRERRREYMARWRRRVYRAPRDQAMLWPREVVLGLD